MSIDWDKPLYDEEGREYLLMRGPDGEPIRTVTEQHYWVCHNGWIYRCMPDGAVRGIGGMGTFLSNTQRPSYRKQLQSFEELEDKNIDIFFGKRDGEWFAEVVPR